MISSLIPKTYGQVKDISEAYQEVEQFKDWCDQNKEAYKIALKLRDLIKNKGVHPSGVLLSYYDLETICPTEFSSDKEPVSSFDMNWVSLFNIKLDILGLRSVSVVDDVCKNIGFKVEDIDLNHESIYRNLQDLKNEFLALRKSTDLFLLSLNDNQLQQIGTANNNTITVNAIAYIVFGHLMHHKNIIEERYL
jgi:DNA polymerase III alpha subunit